MKTEIRRKLMRILLAEDEYDLRKALEVIFKHNNYSIDLGWLFRLSYLQCTIH